MKTIEYKMSKKEILINLLFITAVIFLLGKLFYGEWWYGIGLVPVGVFLFKTRKRDVALARKRKFTREFKDMLVSVSDLVNTGYSVENAIKESYKDLVQIYGENGDICREVKILISQLKVNIPVEKVILDFAERTQLDEAFTFSEVFSVAKKRGGSMSEVIRNITDTIILKETVKEDIEVAIAEKKMEQNIMSIIPLALVAYISFASPGFLDVMYKTWLGRGVMSIALICYMIAFLWSKKILEVEI